MRIGHRLIRAQGSEIVHLGRCMISANVRHDAEVLEHPGHENGIIARERGRFGQRRLGGIEVSRLELEAAERVERPGGEQPIAQQRRHRIALLQRAPRLRRVTCLMGQNGSPTKRLGEHRLIALARGGDDQGVVGILRVARGP